MDLNQLRIVTRESAIYPNTLLFEMYAMGQWIGLLQNRYVIADIRLFMTRHTRPGLLLFVCKEGLS